MLSYIKVFNVNAVYYNIGVVMLYFKIYLQMMRSMGGLGGSGDKSNLDYLDMESDSDDDDPPELEWMLNTKI